MTGKFCAGKLYRLSVAVREQLLLKIPRDVAAILRNQQRGGSTGDSSDEDDQETGETNDAPMHEADGDSDGEIEVGLAIAPAGFGIVRPAHVGRFGAELHGSSVLFKWNAGDSDDAWLEGKVWKRTPTKVIAAAVFFCVITRNVITRNVITRNYAVITWGRISLQVIPAKVKKEALGIWPL